jgi:hypothetical protein
LNGFWPVELTTNSVSSPGKRLGGELQLAIDLVDRIDHLALGHFRTIVAELVGQSRISGERRKCRI